MRWEKSYESGLIYLDNHRRNFLDIVNELVEVVNEGNCETMLPLIFHRLGFYVEDYFVKKEMALADCKGLPLNDYKRHHELFTNKIKSFHDNFRLGDRAVCEDLLKFLTEWFVGYVSIFGEDAIEAMREKGYE